MTKCKFLASTKLFCQFSRQHIFDFFSFILGRDPSGTSQRLFWVISKQSGLFFDPKRAKNGLVFTRPSQISWLQSNQKVNISTFFASNMGRACPRHLPRHLPTLWAPQRYHFGPSNPQKRTRFHFPSQFSCSNFCLYHSESDNFCLKSRSDPSRKVNGPSRSIHVKFGTILTKIDNFQTWPQFHSWSNSRQFSNVANLLNFSFNLVDNFKSIFKRDVSLPGNQQICSKTFFAYVTPNSWSKFVVGFVFRFQQFSNVR